MYQNIWLQSVNDWPTYSIFLCIWIFIQFYCPQSFLWEWKFSRKLQTLSVHNAYCVWKCTVIYLLLNIKHARNLITRFSVKSLKVVATKLRLKCTKLDIPLERLQRSPDPQLDFRGLNSGGGEVNERKRWWTLDREEFATVCPETVERDWRPCSNDLIKSIVKLLHKATP